MGHTHTLHCTHITVGSVKQENCVVVLLYVLMDDTPTIDVMWIFLYVFSIYVYNAGMQFLIVW